MSYTQSNPFCLSTSWSQTAPYGASAFSANWPILGTVGDPTYPTILYNTATPPAGLATMAQMSVIGATDNVRTGFFCEDGGFTAQEVSGQKFDTTNQNYGASVDEAISGTSTGGAFRAVPTRSQSSGFNVSTSSRLMLFALEVS